MGAEQAACREFRKVHSEKDAKAAFVNLAEEYGFLNKESDSDSDKDSSSPGSDSSQNEQIGTDEIKFVNFNLIAEVEGVPHHPSEVSQDSDSYEAFLEMSVVHGTDHFCTDLNPAVAHVMTSPDTPEIDISGPSSARKNRLQSIEEAFDTFKVAQRNYSSSEFQGCCMDTGAQSSLIGQKQAKAYCHQNRH